MWELVKLSISHPHPESSFCCVLAVMTQQLPWLQVKGGSKRSWGNSEQLEDSVRKCCSQRETDLPKQLQLHLELSHSYFEINVAETTSKSSAGCTVWSSPEICRVIGECMEWIFCWSWLRKPKDRLLCCPQSGRLDTEQWWLLVLGWQTSDVSSCSPLSEMLDNHENALLNSVVPSFVHHSKSIQKPFSISPSDKAWSNCYVLVDPAVAFLAGLWNMSSRVGVLLLHARSICDTAKFSLLWEAVYLYF